MAATGIAAIAGAALAAGGALMSLASSTEEYRVSQGKLNTAFDTAGYSAEAAQGVYEDFYGILGDTDTATEASQLLAKLSNNQEDLSIWTDIAAGVYGTFGDSLPIEGLIESANETAKVGQVTGNLADALNWAGISEDEFNQKLAACTSETQRNQLIMNTLSGTYDEASAAFYRNNQAIIQSRNNQAMLQQSLATVGGAVATFQNTILSAFTPTITSAANTVAGFANQLNLAFSEGGLQGVVTAGSQIITNIITGIVEGLPQVVETAVNIISSLLEGIKQNLPQIANGALDIIMSLVDGVIALLPEIITLAGKLIVTLAGALITHLPELVAKIPQIVAAIVQGFVSLASEFLGIGADIVSGIWNGIKEKATWLKEQVKGFFGGIITGVKELLGIESPSKVFAEVGKNMALGVGAGWDDEFSSIKAGIESGMSFGTATVDFANSSAGITSAAVVNAIASTGESQLGGNFAFNLIMPDGTKFAEYYLPSFIRTGSANGTPILNPR